MSLVETLRGRVDELKQRQKDLETLVSDPGEAGKATYPGYLRELGSLQKVLEPWLRYVQADEAIQEAREMIAGDDPEMAELAKEEIPELEAEMVTLEKDILDRVLEDDPDADKPAIVEIRAGAGGDEAALFVGDLYRMYTNYSVSFKWKTEVLSMNSGSAGGVKEVIAMISGEKVYSRLKYESGVHRVQRVPATESQGRIHTSTATVAVLPEAEEFDLQISDKDLKIDVMRAGGPGGQSVNTTDSAVRITHIPTGLVVICQDEKSQHKNKAKALRILRSRIFDLEQAKLDAERRDERRSQVGSGERSEKIRTYNFPQDRLTDHRIGLTKHNLQGILDGDLQDLIDAVRTHFQAEALKQAGDNMAEGTKEKPKTKE